MQSKRDRIVNIENKWLQCNGFFTLQFVASEQLSVVVSSVQRFVRVVPFIRELLLAMEPRDCLLLHRKSLHPGGKVRHLSTSGNRSNLKRRSSHKRTCPRNNLALPRSVTIAYSLPCVRRRNFLLLRVFPMYDS